MGSAKAAALPVPVCAHRSRSRPASTCGIAWVWMGVGCWYFSSASARSSAGARPRAAKEVSAAGAEDALPVFGVAAVVAWLFGLVLLLVFVFGTGIACIRIAFVDRWADPRASSRCSEERRGWWGRASCAVGCRGLSVQTVQTALTQPTTGFGALFRRGAGRGKDGKYVR